MHHSMLKSAYSNFKMITANFSAVRMKKICIKSDFEEIFFKLATNDRSDKMFLLTSKFHPQWVVSPCPGAIYMHNIMKKIV